MNIGLSHFLRVLRKTKNETQEQSAKSCGVTRTAFISWEHGGSLPTSDKVRGIAAWAGVTTDEITRVIEMSAAAPANKWAVSVAGHIRHAGSDGISYGELRSKLVALNERELKDALVLAEKTKIVRKSGKGRLTRYFCREQQTA